MKIMNKVLISLFAAISFVNMVQAEPKFIITKVQNDTEEKITLSRGSQRTIVNPKMTSQTNIFVPIQNISRISGDDNISIKTPKGFILTAYVDKTQEFPLIVSLTSDQNNIPLAKFRGKLQGNENATFHIHLRFVQDEQGKVVPAHKYLEVYKQ